MKSFDEIQREAQLAKLRDELGDAFAQWAAAQDRAMDINPIESQRPPEGWNDRRHYDRRRPANIDGYPLGLVIERFRPGTPVDIDAHPDLLRELGGKNG